MSREYFNRMAQRWDKVGSENNQEKLADLASQLDIRRGWTVLDVGTGTGVLIPFLMKMIGLEGNLIALDYAEEMLKSAKSKGFEGNITFLCADILHVPQPDMYFDAVVCYSCFPHFKDKPAALAEIWRILRPGGILSICHTNSRETINKMHHHIPEVNCDMIPENETMREMLLEARFTAIKIMDGNDKYLVMARKP